MSKHESRGRRIVAVSPYTPLAVGFGGIARSTGAYLLALKTISPDLAIISTTASLTGKVASASLEAVYPGVRAYLYNSTLSKKWGVGIGLFARIHILLRADIVMIHATRNWPSVIAASLCRLLRKRYFIIAHATLDVTRMKRTRLKRPFLYPLTSAIVLWSVRGAAAVIVSGPLEKKALPADLAVRTVEIENFYNFDLNEVEPGAFSSSKSYLFVGRIESDKGILKFIEIWKGVAAATSRLVLAGSGSGRYFEDVMSAIRGDPRISYTGELAEGAIRELMKQASIVVLPTGLDDRVTENFGNTIAEALIAGRPALVTKGLHWDQYESSPAIIRFEADAGDVARAVREFDAVDADTYGRMARAAVELSHRFHVSKAILQLNKVFDDVDVVTN